MAKNYKQKPADLISITRSEISWNKPWLHFDWKDGYRWWQMMYQLTCVLFIFSPLHCHGQHTDSTPLFSLKH